MLEDAVTAPITAALLPLKRKACTSTRLSAVRPPTRVTRKRRAMTGVFAQIRPPVAVGVGVRGTGVGVALAAGQWA